MPSAPLRLLLFVSSYFPLSVIFFFLLKRDSEWIAIGSLSVGVMGLMGLALFFRAARKIHSEQFTIKEISPKDSEAMSYMMTYVIPFLAISNSTPEQSIALAIFFIVLAVLYMNSSMIYINPILNLVRYRIYEVRLSDESVHAVISRRRLAAGETVSFRRVADSVLLFDASGGKSNEHDARER